MKYNIENRIKDTAIVNLTDFENAIDLYEDGEIEKALELMFGLTILGLGGEFLPDRSELSTNGALFRVEFHKNSSYTITSRRMTIPLFSMVLFQSSVVRSMTSECSSARATEKQLRKAR